MTPVELTEKLLAEAGGWQAMKHARALCEMGRVVSANYTPPLLKGVVRDGEKEFRAGLKITSRTNIENICTCRESREWGTICAHSLAVGVAMIRPKESLAARAPQTQSQPVEKRGPFFSTAALGEGIALHVILSPNFQAAWDKDQVMIGLEVEQAGRRLLIHALDPAKAFQCSPEDLRVIETIRSLVGGELSGMVILSREKARKVLEALRGHARVTFGKGATVNVELLLAEIAPAGTAPAQVAPTEASAAMAPEFSLTLEGSLNFLTARLQCLYGQRVVTLGLTSRGDTFSGRNLAAESRSLDRLLKSGFVGPDTTGHYKLSGERQILSFFAQEYPRLEREWSVTLGSRFAHVTEQIERVKPRLEIRSSGEDWFELTVTLAAPGGEHFSSAEIQRLLQMGQNHLRLRNSKVAVFDSALLDELQNVLVDCNPQQTQPGTYRINRMQAGYIDAAMGDGAEIHASADWQQWSSAQRQLQKMQPIPLGSLEDVLRPYQKEGVYWMNFLARNGLAGILADDMGLGKTLQALAFLRTVGGPALIVCPSSLIFNWQQEAARFTPEIRTLAITGADRHSSFEKLTGSDLVITSYPLLRRDIDEYRGVTFSAVILDEAQHIKNPDTQNAQSATALRAKHRFVLTGTPMENSVRDLWSIMHFLMPGYLGTRDDFKERYEQPISQGDSTGVQQRLAKRLRPFMLRRLKRQVAAELPDKIEQVAYCELTGKQRGVYDELLSHGRQQIEAASGEKNIGKARMLVLTALLRLRQACCDLRLLHLSGSDEASASAKVALLDELLQEAIDGGHRVLVFSQFATMLQILKTHLEQTRIGCCHLDGATKDRRGTVDRFQNEGGPPVFLISLKAGGTGLNLTAADTVVHFDPWWNPAVEAQATDRAHRIGQRKAVTSYKLIARGTVEEKILTLQRKKRELIDATVEGEEPLMNGLSMEEIESLLV